MPAIRPVGGARRNTAVKAAFDAKIAARDASKAKKPAIDSLRNNSGNLSLRECSDAVKLLAEVSGVVL